MNKDLLMCKRKALEIVASENPPRKDDSGKRGYIKVMKQLWEESGYQNLGLKAQNLRDQASQLEKLQESSATTTLEESLLEISSRSTQTLTGMVNCDAENNQNYDDQESHYANSSSTSMLDLHTPTALQVPEEQPINEHNDEFNDILCTELPGSLPEFTPAKISRTIVWSQSSENVITVNSSEIDKAYDEITAWRKNSFLVPYGKTGRDFIDQLTKHLNAWNNGSESQHVASKSVYCSPGARTAKTKSKIKSKRSPRMPREEASSMERRENRRPATRG